MPVILLVNSPVNSIDQLTAHFQSKFEVVILTGSFSTIRSSLANQLSSRLYIIPNLTKPERYEIFCLCRKNEQSFVTLSIGDGTACDGTDVDIAGSSTSMSLPGSTPTNSNSPADATNSPASASDRNLLVIEQFDSLLVEAFLRDSKVAPTTANRRSKGVSLRGLGDLKNLINEANKKYQSDDVQFILQECEDRIVKMWKIISRSSMEEATECYCKMVENELKQKGFRK